MGLFDNVKSSVGSLFNRPAVKQVNLKLDLDADPGMFYSLSTDDGPSAGHAIFNKNKVTRGPLELGARVPLNCMFEAHWLVRDGQRVGLYFVSQFQVMNHGGYLVTWITNGAGKATSVETLLKTDDLVIYHYPHRGTLLVSPKINEEVLNIFEEQ